MLPQRSLTMILMLVACGCGGFGVSGLDEASVKSEIRNSSAMYSADLTSLEVTKSSGSSAEVVGTTSSGTKYTFTVKKSGADNWKVSWSGGGGAGSWTSKRVEVRGD